jgi:uridine kinase
MTEVKVLLTSGKEIVVPYGTRASEILTGEKLDGTKNPVVAVLVNNELTSLSYKIEVNSTLSLVTLDTAPGIMTYRRSLSFLLSIASSRVFPDRKLVIGHSLGDGYYYYYDEIDELKPADLDRITAEMRSLVSQNLPIQRTVISYTEAVEYFENSHYQDTALLLRHRNESKIPVYTCAEFMDLAHGPLVPRTGLLSAFELMDYAPGFLLRFPPHNSPLTLAPFRDSPLLFSIYREYKSWGKILDIRSVGRLNELSSTRNPQEIRQFINVSEALHDKKISEIADRIHDRRRSGPKPVKAVLIAGPSSSGKTTFTKKLAIQLKVIGLEPVTISLDDYFLPRELTPVDENGDYDFESIKAIDIPLLNEHLLRLFEGEEIEVPQFDFKLGRRREKGTPVRLPPRGIVVMEGIHGLNDELTPLIDRNLKYKIYVSALTQLNLDDRNRISTTDNRLLRRLVRDYQFRGYNALSTLERWPSVRRGEEKNIFPFQNTADTAFNSALDYELSVLKTYAEPLLRSVKPYHQVYHEAMRLLSFLSNFAPIPAKYVPDHSILREFIGESSFKY